MNVLLTGCSGFIAQKWIERLATNPAIRKLVLLDKEPPRFPLPATAIFIKVDLRSCFTLPPEASDIDHCYHLAAVCREPGYSCVEFFDHNYRGTINLLSALEITPCHTIVFTSTMAVYGPTNGPATESYPPSPAGHYGASKLACELLLKSWQASLPGRRLIVCRPAVIYGPGDTHNIPRMIKAVRKGYFAIPSGREVKKAVGYVYGLLDSFEFCLRLSDRTIFYNYAAFNCYSIRQLAGIVQAEFNIHRPLWRIPFGFLHVFAVVVHNLSFGLSPIHPVRVKKVVSSTEIVPKFLMDRGFSCDWTFDKSLSDWRKRTPEDFM